MYRRAVAIVIYDGRVAVARSDGRSEWERNLAAQRREAERQERERVRLAKEREKARLQQHLESQQRTTEQKTAAVERQVEALDEVLASVLPLPSFSFEHLMVSRGYLSSIPVPWASLAPR